MPNQDQFHALLKERVETTRKEHETAVTLLREFERMFFNGAAVTRSATTTTTAPAPTPAPVAARPAAPTPTPQQARPEARTVEAERGTNKDGSARKKPGPAKGTNVNAKKVQARAKASAKAAQPARTKKVAKGSQKTKTGGTVVKTKGKSAAKAPNKPGPKPGDKAKRPNIPSLVNGIQMIMGRKTMNAEQVFEALKAKGWLPASNDPLGYIRYTLSKNKDIFLRVEGRRGHYFLDPNNTGKADKRNGKAEAAPVEAASNDAENVVNEVDDLLAKSGVDINGPNPFADQTAS